MKLITFENAQGEIRLGALQRDDETKVIDLLAGATDLGLSKDALDCLSSMLDLIESGKAGLDFANEIVSQASKYPPRSWSAISSTSIQWRCPLIDPPQLRDCLMFEEHLKNAFGMLRKTLAAQSDDPDAALKDFEARGLYAVPEVWYKVPVYYKVNRFSFIGHEQDIIWPEYSEKMDFELEFACVLNRRLKDVTVEEAKQCIFGYTIYNDVSARDVQSIEMQAQLGPSKGKDFDTGNILGPCIVTADEVDPQDMDMIARINGKELCRGNSGSSYWTFPEVIAHASRSETLVAGELIGSGTVGWGCGLEHGQFLDPGDVIELEVKGIGTLRNRIVRENKQHLKI